MGEGGSGEKKKGWTAEDGTPEGWLEEGRNSYTQWDPPMVRSPAATGETLGEMVGEVHKGTEGKGASAFLVHLDTGESVGLLGLILCLWSLPVLSRTQVPPLQPHPGPYLYNQIPPPKHWAYIPPTHSHSRPYLQTSELHTPEALLWTCCLFPSMQVLSKGSAPFVNIAPPRPCPQGLFLLLPESRPHLKIKHNSPTCLSPPHTLNPVPA